MTVIDDYVGQFVGPPHKEMQRLCSIARKQLPGADEAITYSMPTFIFGGKSIIGFDVHKNHIGIYPFSGHVISSIPELKGYSTTKGAIREKLDNLLPPELIEKIILERLRQAGV